MTVREWFRAARLEESIHGVPSRASVAAHRIVSGERMGLVCVGDHLYWAPEEGCAGRVRVLERIHELMGRSL